MPLLTGDDLHRVVQLFNTRGVYIYHACQLKDFDTYVQLGGIPSRHKMEVSGLPYTIFDTDRQDHNNGVWPKVFANLSDFGHGFAEGNWSEGKAPTPNPYGPILLVARPEILLDASDVAICLRSAGGRNFNRDRESLHTQEEVDRLFVNPANASTPASRAYVKYSSQLKQNFGHLYNDGNAPSTYNPEVSCTVANEVLPFTHLSHIIVERFYKDNISFLSRVADIAFPGGLRVEIRERRYREGRRPIMADLAHILREALVTPAQLAEYNNCAEETKDWSRRIISEGLEWQYTRFAKYFREGTLIQA